VIADLTGKTALVTGAGQGVGRAIARTLVEQGAAVAIGDINDRLAAGVAQEIEQGGGQALAVHLDVRSRASIAAALDRILDRWDHLDILVNNAGVARAPSTPDGAADADDEWHFVMEVNLRGTVNCSELVLPHMAARRYGKILNIGSTAGKAGDPLPPVRPVVEGPSSARLPAGSAYSLSKAGIIRYTQLLAGAAAPSNVNVNCVCPSRMLTQMGIDIAALARSSEPDLTEEEIVERRRLAVLEGNRFGRPLEPVDIARMVAFLVSDDARNVTGQSINVDGGFKMA
jgi:meso-butanediol dehydrogenase / (S,S)-butanediol dehydrogenase / diacetyl reductase